MREGSIEVVVSRRRTEALGIVSLELRPAAGGALPPFAAGSHVDVHLPSGLVRQYSLLNAPGETDRYVIGVLQDEAGRGGSREVHEMLHEGVRLTIGPPRNNFPLDLAAGHSVLVAGGIGITPMLSMASALTSMAQRFDLHYCARSEAQAAFLDRLRQPEMAGRAQFHFDDDVASRMEPMRDIGPPAEGKMLYVCGPAGFMDYVVAQAAALGWPAERVRLERFQAKADEALSGDSFTVVTARSGVTVEVPSGKSIAEALGDAGVAVPLSCEIGICGTCLTPVLDGVPDHRDEFQTDEEKAGNSQIAVCCSRSKTKVIVLDI